MKKLWYINVSVAASDHRKIYIVVVPTTIMKTQSNREVINMDYEKNLGNYLATFGGLMFTAIACLYMIAVSIILECETMSVADALCVGGAAAYFVVVILMFGCAIAGGIKFLHHPGEFNRLMSAMRSPQTERFI